MIKSRLSARGRKGFTLIELLVVVLILAILMAVALPLYVSSVKDASDKTCRANMQSIANAAQAWKVKGRKADYTDLIGANATALKTALGGDLGEMPVGPGGGVYTIEAGTEADGTTATNASFKVTSGAPDSCGSFEPGKNNS